MKTALSGISRSGGSTRCGVAHRHHFAALAPRHPAPVQLGDELLGAVVDARAHAHLLQELHEPHVALRVVVGEHLAHVARIRQALPLGHAQEQARQPVGEVAADEEQVVVLELVEELLGREVLALQRAHELQHVLVGDHVGGRRRAAPEQVIDDRTLQLIALARQVGNAVGRVGDDLGGLRAAEALGVHRLLEQRIESRRDEEVEVGDLGELAQRKRRGEGDVAQDAAHARVRVLAPAVGGQEPADHVVERVALGQHRDVHAQLRREFLRDPVVEQARARVGLHVQQLRAHDGDHPALLDEVDEVVPGVLVEPGMRRQLGHVAHRLTEGPLVVGYCVAAIG